MLAVKILAVVVGLYLAFISSGFSHEGGHSIVGDWVGVEISAFSPSDCLRLRCQVSAEQPLTGIEGSAVLFAGGVISSVWWLAVYLVTKRWHRTGGWMVGGVAIAFFTGELVIASFEGGWNWFYTTYEFAVLLLTMIAMGTAFTAQLYFAGHGARLDGIRHWVKPNSWLNRNSSDRPPI